MMEALVEEGWSLDANAVIAEGVELTDNKALRRHLLDIDLKKVGKPCLPIDISHKDHLQLDGPYVLQIVSATDVSHPSTGGSGAGKNRLLLLKLTDGKTSVKAVEFKALHQVDVQQLLPGTKIQLSPKATCRCGCILLGPKTFKVLGGYVEGLVEAFEFQQRFQGDRSATQSSTDDAKAPRFSHFVPGKTRAPSLYTDKGQVGARPPSGAPPGLGAVNGGAQTKQGGLEGPRGAEDEEQDASKSTQALQKQQAERIDRGSGAKEQLLQAKVHGAAKEKLTQRLHMSEKESGQGRGRGRGRGRRRRGYDDEDEPGSMTLEEWEARQSTGRSTTNGTAACTDEELARRMQEEFDLEDAHEQALPIEGQPAGLSLAEELNKSLFSYDRPQESHTMYRGRGRGRSRGRHRG